MKKSSLGRRSSSQDTSGFNKLDTKRSLLQPGFLTKRTLSEEKLSCSKYFASNTLFGTSSARKSRGDMSYFGDLNICTPKYFKQNVPGQPQTVSLARPRRSQSASSDSKRFSSIGGAMQKKRELRPINDPGFINESVRKLMNYFDRNPSATSYLFESKRDIKPMSLNKFINMSEYLLVNISELNIITKEHYIDDILKIVKLYQYPGKLDRAMLQTVSAKHSWPNVIAFLSWLVDLVLLQESFSQNIVNTIYPESYGNEEDNGDESSCLLEQYIRENHQQLVEDYQIFCSNKSNIEAIFEEKDNLFIEKLLHRNEVSEKFLQELQTNIDYFKNKLNDHDYKEKMLKFKKLEELLEVAVANHKIYNQNIEGMKIFIKNTVDENANLTEKIDMLKKNIIKMEKTVESLKVSVNEFKSKMSNISDLKKKRTDIQITINFKNKELEKLDLTLHPLIAENQGMLKKLEKPIIEYNNLLVNYRKNEPRLESCSISDPSSLVNDPEEQKKVFEVDQILQNINSDWKIKIDETNRNIEKNRKKLDELKVDETNLLHTIDLKTKEIENLSKNMKNVIENKEKECKNINDQLNELKSYLVDDYEDEIEQLKELCENQEKEIKRVMNLAMDYFTKCILIKTKVQEELGEKTTLILEQFKELKLQHEKLSKFQHLD